MRLSRRIRRLLLKALREENTQYAIELFLAARLLYIVHMTNEGGEEVIEKVLRKIDVLDAGLENISSRLKALLETAQQCV